jgi:hypothetical protein
LPSSGRENRHQRQPVDLSDDELKALDKLDLLVNRHGLYLSSTIIQQVRRALAGPRPGATEEQ